MTIPRALPAFDPLKGKPQNKPFADAMRAAMAKGGRTQSSVAKGMWGLELNGRGAKNRDRIGKYLAGISLPEPGNHKLLETELGLQAGHLESLLPRTAPKATARTQRSPITAYGQLGLADDDLLLLLNFHRLREDDQTAVLAEIFRRLAT